MLSPGTGLHDVATEIPSMNKIQVSSTKLPPMPSSTHGSLLVLPMPLVLCHISYIRTLCDIVNLSDEFLRYYGFRLAFRNAVIILIPSSLTNMYWDDDPLIGGIMIVRG
ncbi:hypothetical protein TIFTF001_026078 [Ficus carica]|uniref:Uncharacterized protein n=1 Tax=Ficus carica TaxID=3494 RepID=A0AA88DET4_FICCA|nr:hypothetical protein TIFTF001_026078 [Ficus carica]